MGRTYESIDDRLSEWLVRQPVFFVATAPIATDGYVNCSPKRNQEEFVVLDGRRVAYLDHTGSGIETIAHLNENGRIVLMFCAFDGPPRIVRLHGRGRPVRPGEDSFDSLSARFPRGGQVGIRAVIVVETDRISDSCGYGVPIMPFGEHRPTMDEWSERKGPDGIAAYWSEKNSHSLDGLPGI
jgi:Pyridoxamine 5'-phosphate oxidase